VTAIVLGVIISVLVLGCVVALVGCAVGASRSLREDRAYALEQAKLTREQRIRRLEMELGIVDPADARVLPDGQIVSARSRIETRSPHRAYQLSDREVARLLLRHKGAA